MRFFRWLFLLMATFALAQDPVPFAPETARPWEPAWELRLRGDRLSGSSEDAFQRAGVQLRLRWTAAWDHFLIVGGTVSTLGSDGNALNAPRWDQQPSNGTQLDQLNGTFTAASANGFGNLRLGLQDNPLVVSEALWDRDLRFLGAGGGAGWRSAGGLVQEAGFRGAAGRVRNLLGGEMDLAAGQLVLKLETGAWSWAAHVDRWDLTWNAGSERLYPMPGHRGELRQRLRLDAAGLGGTWNAPLPLEARWTGFRNPVTRQDSEEFQLRVGSRERLYWPQVTYTWQRLSSTGTLYPVNGDEWWFYRGARGPRADLAVPCPGRWLVTLTVLRQNADNEAYSVRRVLFTVLKRF